MPGDGSVLASLGAVFQTLKQLVRGVQRCPALLAALAAHRAGPVLGTAVCMPAQKVEKESLVKI